MEIKNYINGKLVSSNNTIDIFDPSVGEVYGQAPNSTKEDVDQAVVSAKESFHEWSKTSIGERSRLLHRIADLIDRDLDKLAKAESKDNGKPFWLAKKVDIPRASSNFRYFANAITQFSSECFENVGNNSINYTLNEPLGPVACISPWNLPLYLFSWKIAPALAVGNTVVAKPSEVTPMTAFLLSELCIEAGLPKGVLNIIHGEGHVVGDALTNHKDIKAISFTGSTRVGNEIAKIAARDFKKVSLEMGGKNPNLIFADCDYDKMLKTTISSSFANQGQICLCGSRVLVEESIYEKFKEDFLAMVRNIKVGLPNANDTKLGAIVSKPHYEKIKSYIEIAKSEGGRIIHGGEAVHPNGGENGWYIQPTVIEGLNQKCRTNQEEIFGPVVTLESFKGDEEAIEKANATDYGLSATIWTQNLTRAHKMAKELEAGIVWINTWLNRDLRTPFGGVKNSGMGREGGFEALRFFTEPKNVCIQL